MRKWLWCKQSTQLRLCRTGGCSSSQLIDHCFQQLLRGYKWKKPSMCLLQTFQDYWGLYNIIETQSPPQYCRGGGSSCWRIMYLIHTDGISHSLVPCILNTKCCSRRNKDYSRDSNQGCTACKQSMIPGIDKRNILKFKSCQGYISYCWECTLPHRFCMS